MKWFFDMKIGARLIAAFVLVGSIAAVVGYEGITSLAKIAELSAASYAQETMGITHLKDANIDMLHIVRYEKNMILATTTEQRTKYRAEIDKAIAEVNTDLEQARPLIHTEKGKAVLADFDRLWIQRQELFHNTADQVMKEPLPHERPSVAMTFGIGVQMSNQVEGLLDQLNDMKAGIAKSSAETTEATYRSSRTAMLICIVVGVLAGVIFGIFIARSISKPLAAIADAAKHISLGDVNQSIDYHAGDEVGSQIGRAHV